MACHFFPVRCRTKCVAWKNSRNPIHYVSGSTFIRHSSSNVSLPNFISNFAILSITPTTSVNISAPSAGLAIRWHRAIPEGPFRFCMEIFNSYEVPDGLFRASPALSAPLCQHLEFRLNIFRLNKLLILLFIGLILLAHLRPILLPIHSVWLSRLSFSFSFVSPILKCLWSSCLS